MRDLRIINDKSGPVVFQVYDSKDDSGLMLLQRLYVLLLSDQTGAYRQGDGYTLLSFLEGGNTPPDGVMNSILAISCATALNMLDEEDRSHINSFTGNCEDGLITCTLTLTDGTTIQGTLANE